MTPDPIDMMVLDAEFKGMKRVQSFYRSILARVVELDENYHAGHQLSTVVGLAIEDEKKRFLGKISECEDALETYEKRARELA